MSLKKNALPNTGIQQQTHRRRCADSTSIAIFAEYSTRQGHRTIICLSNARP
jgi:hypothetical protein